MRPIATTTIVLALACPLSIASASAAGEEAIRGVDVSHFSGSVDWDVVANQGLHFAYVKATEGVDGADPLFAAHWKDLEGSGLHRGAYHFYVTEDDPEAQARFFLETARPGPGDLRPVVDVETIGHGTEPGWPDGLRRFLEIVEEEVGVAPIVYTSPKFWSAHVKEDLGHYPLWIAEYGVEEPTVPSGWDGWWLWQWKGDARLSGVEKDVDLSRAHPEIGLDDLLVPSRDR